MVAAIAAYLWGVYREAGERGYHFDVSKIAGAPTLGKQVQVSAIRTVQNHLVALSIQVEGMTAGELQENLQPSTAPTQEVEGEGRDVVASFP